MLLRLAHRPAMHPPTLPWRALFLLAQLYHPHVRPEGDLIPILSEQQSMANFFSKGLFSCYTRDRPCVIAKQHVTRALRVWASGQLKKNESPRSWMARVTCEVVKRDRPLDIREIIAGEDNAI